MRHDEVRREFLVPRVETEERRAALYETTITGGVLGEPAVIRLLWRAYTKDGKALDETVPPYYEEITGDVALAIRSMLVGGEKGPQLARSAVEQVEARAEEAAKTLEEQSRG